MSSIFDSLFDSVDSMGPQEFIICMGFALLAGFLISAVYMFKNKHTDSFALTIALLPAIVSVVIMVVSGDIGAGIAVAGAFSLVRFRSAPGTAKEIVVIFLAMATGLLIGMGFIAYALIFAVIICLVILAYSSLNFGNGKVKKSAKVLKVMVPEDLDYNSEIDSVINEYSDSMELVMVKSTNMGSMFRLTYNVTLKDESKQKELIDKIRVRNGNLEVAVCRQETDNYGL
ncbi:MAG: DUF4956 domain-containing protein [Candidatus Methanomethylophilaceae archaeon]|nr:DUF4956 domain-containing protein [Candidatus Methanomethylophilaceae archaeon]